MEKPISIPLLANLRIKAWQYRTEPNDSTEKEFFSAFELVKKFDRGEGLDPKIIQELDITLRENLPGYAEVADNYNKKISGFNKER